MARTPRTTAPEVIDAPVNQVALAAASTALATVSEQALQIQQTFGLETLDPSTLTIEISGLIQQTGRALFAMGGRLCALRAVLPGEAWRAKLDQLGFSPRVASRLMSSALKCVDQTGEARERLMSLPQSKVLELVALDEDKLDELEQTGAIGQLSLEFDEIDRLSASELRKRVRELQASNAAKDKVISKKGSEIDKLHESAERRSAAPDAEETLAQEQIATLRDATEAAELALHELGNTVRDLTAAPAQPHVTTAAHTSMEYIAQWLADLIKRTDSPVQFEDMVTPEWQKPAPKGRKG